MGSGKIELDIASKIADAIVHHIQHSMVRLHVAGSVRRKKPVVGDIELVGVVEDENKLIKSLQDVGQTIKPGVPDVIPWSPKPGAKYIRVRLNEGMNLDLFLGTPQNFGGLYLMRTGSGAGSSGKAFDGFTPGIFRRFKKLSGGGRMTGAMPTMPTGEQLWVPEEKDFFDLLEMDFVPPEARVDHKVIKKYVRKQ